MSERPVYVYRLDVTYPPGSLELGWEPEGWVAEDYVISSGPDAGALDSDAFRWPENRLCLSQGTAKRRADLFRQYGAEATVARSERVMWAVPG